MEETVRHRPQNVLGRQDEVGCLYRLFSADSVPGGAELFLFDYRMVRLLHRGNNSHILPGIVEW